MSILKSVEINWKGKAYKVDVTMRLINTIESDGVNLMRLASRLADNDVPLSHVCTVFAHLLQAGGADVTSADIWSAMFGAGDEASSAVDAIQAAALALQCVFPQVEGAGKPTKKQNSRTATRGKKSTKQ